MPAAPMDALGAFAHLSDNLPSWMTQLSDLTTYTAAKNAEFAEAFRKHSTGLSRPRHRRNSSVCSIQTSLRPQSTSSSATSQRRKRGAGDAASFESGNRPDFVSTRHNLVIHYDGYTQKALEEMVRNIGTARNNLRKGKMSQLPLAGFRMKRHAAQPELPSLQSEPSDEQLLSNIRSARTRGMPPVKNTPRPRESPFDIADKQLELAHGLCETAAYHFLRTGNCAQELNSVKDKLSMLLNLATNEVQRLKREQMSDPVEEAEETRPVRANSLKRPASNEGPIEIDDDSASVESIDLAVFRVSRMRR